MNNALDIQELAFRYPDGVEALRGFSAVVGPSETVGLVGANGAGKTTLILALAGFLEAHSGSIRVFDRPLDPHHPEAIRKDIGFTFPNPDDQLFMPTVMEDVCFGLLSAGFPVPDAKERTRRILDELEIGDLADRFPGHLSAGQKRLATLAGVLVMEPRLLALDEPTSFLDPHARRQVIRRLAALPHPKLIVTHDLELVLELCQKVIVLSNGRNVADGVPRNILADTRLMEANRLEVPYSLGRR